MKYCLVKYPVSGNIYLATKYGDDRVIIQCLLLDAGKGTPIDNFPNKVPIGELGCFILCESEDTDGA